MTAPAARAPRVLVVGDVMIDDIVRLEGPIAAGSDRRATIASRPGGSAANQAVWLAHFGVEVDFVARVGASDRRREAARLRRAGVDAHLAADSSRQTGRLIALVDPTGERSFLTDRGANEALEAGDIADALIAGAALICMSGYCFFAPSSRAAALDVLRRAAGRPVAVDPASAEFLREVGAANFLAWTRGAAMLFPNGEEAAVLAGSEDPHKQRERLSAHYPLVVVKRGAAGCEAFEGETRWRVEAPAAKALDSTGAGDAFLAAFLAARLQGEDMEESLRRAVAAGSAATQFVGARPPLPPLRVSGEPSVRREASSRER
jgi:sugar/nucleoside kinase (ribokinase family)